MSKNGSSIPVRLVLNIVEFETGAPPEGWGLRRKILDLPFDLAQGGELVEPFRASC